jgi:peptidoglycan/LPS O-acetylase OafA/YrhL
MPKSPQSQIPEPIIRRSMPELDSVRGVAILMVVVFHGFVELGTAGFSGIPRIIVAATIPGWMGVNLFFVLSGFLITGILLDTRFQPHYYRNFYIRRALRILPAYYLLLVVLYLLPRVGLDDERRVSWKFIALSFVYLSNVTNLFRVPMQYGPLWSLAVEEHFYLLWPTAVRFLSRKNLAWLAGAVFLGCPLIRAIAYQLKYAYGQPYTWFVADGLAAGALLACYCRREHVGRAHILRASMLCMGTALILLAGGLPFGIVLSRTLAGGSLRVTMLNLFFAGALGATLLVGTSRWRWLVRNRILRFFGEISYGLYLIHMLVFEVFDHFAVHYWPRISRAGAQGHFPLLLARFAVAGSISSAIAFLSRRTWEAWFLSLKDRWTMTPAAAGARSRAGQNVQLA